MTIEVGPHHWSGSRAWSVAKTRRRLGVRMALTALLALATAATWAAAAAPAAHADSNPSCALTSSAPTNVVSTSPPGFSQYWADNNVAVVPVGSGTYQFINSDFHYFAQPPDGTFVGAIQGTLDNPESDGVVSDVGIQGFKASPRRYAGVTSNVYVASANLWIGIYHDEEWNNGSFYSREGFAKSTDQGHTWYDLGETLSPHVPYDPSNTHQIDLYISAFAVINSGGTQYVYEYFKEPNADGTLATQLSVARAPLADLVADAQAGTVPLFYKYYNGSWSEPGLGGNASELRTDGTGNQYFTGSGTIIYDTAISRYLMFGYTNNGADVDAIESPDGLTWGNPQMLFVNTAGGAAYYSTPVGLDGSPTVAGSQFYLYTSVVNLPGSDILQRRTLTCTPTQTGTISVDDAVTGSGVNQFNYQGAYWGSCSSYCSSPTQYLGTEHWDATAGETASVAFNGTGIAVNRPGSDGGSQSTEDESHGSIEEVWRGVA